MSKYALITGASTGIGKALAFEFARDGYDLVLVSSNWEELLHAAQEVKAIREGIQVEVIAKDLAAPNSPHELFDELKGRGIVIDSLVNDAGVGKRGEFVGSSLESDIEIVRLNVEALIRLTKLFLPLMLERNEGGILNVGSIAGFQPGPFLAVYHASKAFIVSFTEALAEELKDSRIRITCLCPGPTATHFFSRAEMESARIVQHGNVMTPQEVAEAGYRAFMDGERVFIPGLINKTVTFMRRVMPRALQAKINKKMYEAVEEQH